MGRGEGEVGACDDCDCDANSQQRMCIIPDVCATKADNLRTGSEVCFLWYTAAVYTHMPLFAIDSISRLLLYLSDDPNHNNPDPCCCYRWVCHVISHRTCQAILPPLLLLLAADTACNSVCLVLLAPAWQTTRGYYDCGDYFSPSRVLEGPGSSHEKITARELGRHVLFLAQMRQILSRFERLALGHHLQRPLRPRQGV